MAGQLLSIVRSNRWKDELLIYDRGRKKPLLAIADIPTALNGAAEFNVANAMAAAAMAYGYGVDLACIRAGLSSFTNLDNPGRLNICDDHGFRVIVDYGHNQASLRALGKVVSALADKYDNVIGMLGMPGDRRDVDLREMGALAAQYFDHIVLRETPDQRGRPPGEMNKLMEEGAVSVGFPKQDITKFLEEFDAVRHCLDTARDGDLVVLMATRYQEVWNIVKSYRRISGARQNASSQEWQTAPGH
jgi:cyanophycin synthetase